MQSLSAGPAQRDGQVREMGWESMLILKENDGQAGGTGGIKHLASLLQKQGFSERETGLDRNESNSREHTDAQIIERR